MIRLRSFSNLVLLGACVFGILACSAPDADETAAKGAVTAPADTAAAGTPEVAADAPAEAPVQLAQAAMDPPEVVAKKFIDAGNSGDKETFKSLLTEKAREGFGEDSELGEDSGFESYTIGETKIDGEQAEVSVDATDNGEAVTMLLRMRQENAAWRVFGMDVDLGDGLVMKMDLEKIGGMLDSMAESMAGSMEGVAESMGESFADAFETSPEELAAQRAKYDGLRVISLEDYEASWKNATDYTGKPAKDAVAALAETVGLSVHLGEAEEALAANVTANVAGMSVPEAVERIANDAGLHALFPDPMSGGGMLDGMAEAMAEGLTEMLSESGISIEGGELNAEPAEEVPANAIRFASGARPYPAAFSGPFMVEITSLQENVPHTTGTLNLTVRAYGLDPSLIALMQNNSESIWFEDIVDAQGRLLTEEGVMYFGGVMTEGTSYTDSYTMELLNLIREVESIARIAGTKQVQRPEGVVELVFAEAVEGATAEAEGFTGTINSAGDYTEISVTTPEGVDSASVAVIGAADTAEGEPMEEPYVSYSSWDEGSVDVSVSTSGAPGSVRIKLVSVMEAHDYPFEITNVPLQHFAEMPEKVEELTFAGAEQPITVEFLELTPETDSSFAEAKIRVINHSNKDAESVSLNMVYLDADDAMLDDFPSGLSGSYEYVGNEMVSTPASVKGSTHETTATAFGMPEGTVKVVVEVTSVDFLDGTSWEAETEW